MKKCPGYVMIMLKELRELFYNGAIRGHYHVLKE